MITRLAQQVLDNEASRHGGLAHSRRHLSANNVREIRASKQSGRMLAAQYEVSDAYISKIKRGLVRKDVE